MSLQDAEAALTIPQSSGFKQTAFVVRDLEASTAAYWRHFRMGPWTGWTITPERVATAHYRGKPARFSFRHALAWRGDVQFELVQPLEGPSIFAEHLDAKGEGLHHIGMYVPDIAKGKADMEASGFTAVQGATGFGADGSGEFCYFETDDPICAFVELIAAPGARRPPDFTFPAEGNDA